MSLASSSEYIVKICRKILKSRSERRNTLTVERTLSAGAHLSLNSMMKSSGGWREEGGGCWECGRMWKTEGVIRGNRSNWVRHQSRGACEKDKATGQRRLESGCRIIKLCRGLQRCSEIWIGQTACLCSEQSNPPKIMLSLCLSHTWMFGTD